MEQRRQGRSTSDNFQYTKSTTMTTTSRKTPTIGTIHGVRIGICLPTINKGQVKKLDKYKFFRLNLLETIQTRHSNCQESPMRLDP
eukprot:6407076-Amphidinium_carterae.2